MSADDAAEGILGAFVGGFYGIILAIVGFMAAGIGEGTYVVIGTAASPVSIAGNIPLAFIAPIALWAIVGCLLCYSARLGARIAFLTIIALHYGCLPFVLTSNTFGDWSYFHQAEAAARSGLMVYGIGQIVLWVAFIIILLVSRRRSA